MEKWKVKATEGPFKEGENLRGDCVGPHQRQRRRATPPECVRHPETPNPTHTWPSAHSEHAKLEDRLTGFLSPESDNSWPTPC